MHKYIKILVEQTGSTDEKITRAIISNNFYM